MKRLLLVTLLVRLASQLRYSGYRSIELRDVAGDGDFPELQGYFPERKTGQLYFHFAMLVANPDEPLNIALAGPRHFSLTPDGIAFWLKTRDGALYHVSDSIPRKLFPLESFAWYLVDVRLDLPRGTYDLTIHKEHSDEPLVALKDQPNAANAPGSSIDKFSFVGSVFEDDSDVTYYVDDVLLGTGETLTLPPFVAPGRRKLFIDRWRETRALMIKNPGCPPVLSYEDYGLPAPPPDDAEAPQTYRRVCALMRNNPLLAARQFRTLTAANPHAPIYPLAELAALVQSDDETAARQRWQQLQPLLKDDPRYGMLAAMMGEETEQQDDETRYYLLLWKADTPAPPPSPKRTTGPNAPLTPSSSPTPPPPPAPSTKPPSAPTPTPTGPPSNSPTSPMCWGMRRRRRSTGRGCTARYASKGGWASSSPRVGGWAARRTATKHPDQSSRSIGGWAYSRAYSLPWGGRPRDPPPPAHPPPHAPIPVIPSVERGTWAGGAPMAMPPATPPRL
jgi:hypothetical protein